MGRIAIAVVGLLALALAGCSSRSDGEEQATPTPEAATTGYPAYTNAEGTSGIDELPVLNVTSDGEHVAFGVPGTRCWGDGCYDYFRPVTLDEPVVIEPGATLELAIERGPTPTAMMRRWGRVDGVEAESPGGGDVVGWPSEERLDSPNTPTEPGDYVLQVFVQWMNQGDISYGVYIRVEA